MTLRESLAPALEDSDECYDSSDDDDDDDDDETMEKKPAATDACTDIA